MAHLQSIPVRILCPLFIILFPLLSLGQTGTEPRQVEAVDTVSTGVALPSYENWVMISIFDTIGVADYRYSHQRLADPHLFLKDDSVCFSLVNIDTNCVPLDQLTDGGIDTLFTVIYGDNDSTILVQINDTIFITYPDPGMGTGDTAYYFVIQVNGTGNDTIVLGEVINFVEGPGIDITQGATNITITNTRDTCFHSLVQLSDTTAALLDCNLDTLGVVTFLGNNAVMESDSCVQQLLVLDPQTFGLTWCNSTEIKDTICIYPSPDNDSYIDSVGIWRNDSIPLYRRDTTGWIDTLWIVVPSDSVGLDTQQLSIVTVGQTDTIFLERGGFVVLHDSVNVDTDEQQLSIVTNGQIDTIFLEDGGFVVLHDSVGVDTDTDDQQLSISTNGQVDTIFLEDGGFVVLHDSVIPDTDDQALSIVTDGAIDTIFLQDGGFVVLHDSAGIADPDADWYILSTTDVPYDIDDHIYSGTMTSKRVRIGQDSLENGFNLLINGGAGPFMTKSAITNIWRQYNRVDSTSWDRVQQAGEWYMKYQDYSADSSGGGIYLLMNGGYKGDTILMEIANGAIYWSQYPPNRIDGTKEDVVSLYYPGVDGIIQIQPIDSISRLRAFADFDFILLHNDTAMTLVDTLIPRDSADLHELIWHGGRVRLGDEDQIPTLYTSNTVLAQDYDDNTGAGLQIYGRRSALDIWHLTRPYIHMRNDLGEFYHRVFDPTGEGPLEPQRYEIGAVGAYDTDDLGTIDTTKRSIFTIMNNADAYSLNITNNFLQSDIYTSARTPDTSNVYGLIAADSSGRFILLQLDSIGNINLVNPPDSDWLAIPTYDIPAIDQDKFTLGKVRIGQDSLESSSVTVMINGGAIPLVTKSTTSVNLFRMEMRPLDMAWDFRAAEDFEFKFQDLGAATTGTYMYYDGGYTSESAIIYLQNDGDIRFNNYPNTRDELELSDSILNIYYPDETGRLNMASIDSLAAALVNTGNFTGSDSLGATFTNDYVILGRGTTAGKTVSDFYIDRANNRLYTPRQTWTGQGLSTEDSYVKVGGGRSGDGNSFLDLNSTTSVSSRFIRTAGTNGDLNITNFGTGNMNYYVNGGTVGLSLSGTNLDLTLQGYAAGAKSGTFTTVAGFGAGGTIITNTASALATFLAGKFQPVGSYDNYQSWTLNCVDCSPQIGTVTSGEAVWFVGGSGITVSSTTTPANYLTISANVTAYQNLGSGTRTATTYPLTISNGSGHTLATFSSTQAGLVPAPNPAGLVRFLREDGTWQSPSTSGGGIYSGSGSIGNGTDHVTARLATNRNFRIRHQSEDKLVVGDSGVYLVNLASGGSVHVGERASEWVFSHSGNYPGGSTRMHSKRFGTGSRLDIVDNSGNVALIAGTASNMELTAGTNLNLTAQTGDFNLLVGNNVGDDITMTSTFGTITMDAGNDIYMNADLTVGLIEMTAQEVAMRANLASYVVTPSAISMSGGSATNGVSVTGKMGINTIPNATHDIRIASNDAAKGTAGSWVATSDERLKQNIHQIDSKSAIDKLLGLRGVNYEWTEHSKKMGFQRREGQQWGLIAQDIVKVFGEDPHFVSKDDDGYYMAAYGNYDPLIIESIRYLKQKNDTLESTVQELIKRIEKIEKDKK